MVIKNINAEKIIVSTLSLEATPDYFLTVKGNDITIHSLNTSNWDEAYNNRITSLTTIGNYGGATLIANVLNIPQYTLEGLGGTTDHTLLENIGTYTHPQIDDHINDGTIHYTQGAISITYSQVSDFSTGVALNTNVANIAGGGVFDIQGLHDYTRSAGHIEGGIITDNGSETVNVSTGKGYIRAVANDISTLYAFGWAGVTGMAIPTNSIRYLYVWYDAGTPFVTMSSSENYDYQTSFPIGFVINENGTLFINNVPHSVGRAVGRLLRRHYEVDGRSRANELGGLIIYETDTKKVAVSTGVTWFRGVRTVFPPFDSNVSDTFDNYYRDGGGGWTKQTAQTTLPLNLYDDNSGTLQLVGNNSRAVYWMYLDASNMIVLVYGRGNYPNLTAAQSEAVPSDLPLRLQVGAILLGRYITVRSFGTSTVDIIESAFETAFAGASITDHNSLSGLQGGQAGEYYHLTAAELAAIANIPTDYTLSPIDENDQFTLNYQAVPVSTIDLSAYAKLSDVFTGNAIIQGGVIYDAILNQYYVWATKYIIANVVYTTPVSGYVSLSTGDLTYARIDVFYVQNDGINPATVGVLQGDADGQLVEPSLDLNTQVQVGFKIVGIAEATPPNITDIMIYDENVGQPSEFAIFTPYTGGNPDYTVDKYKNTKAYYLPATATLKTLRFSTSVPFQWNTTTRLIFAIKTPTSWTNQARLTVKLIAVAGNSTTRTLDRTSATNYNIIHTNPNWQIAVFTLTEAFSNIPASVEAVEFTFNNTPNMIMDWVYIQNGITPAVSPTSYSFLSLTDTPSNYTGSANKIVGVNSTGTGLEFKPAVVDTGSPVYVVASSVAPTVIKNRADYICDGVNDEVEILAALALGNVRLTEGTFAIASVITLPSGRTLEGSGRSTILNATGMTGGYEQAQVATNTMIKAVSPSRDLVVKNLMLNGNGCSYGAWLSGIGSGTYTTAIQGIDFENVYFSSITSTGIKMLNCHNSKVTNCDFFAVNQDGITLTRTSGESRTSHVIISNNNFHGGLAAVFVYYAQDIVISNNIFTGQTEYNIQMDYPKRIVIDGNHMGSTASISHITATGETSSTEVCITNNYCTGAAQNGIEVIFVQNSTIVGNTVQGSGWSGIYVEDTNGTVVSSNNVSDCSVAGNITYNGITVMNMHGGVLANNVIRRGAGANRHNYGIEVFGSTTDYLLITGNDLYQSGVTGDLRRGSTTGGMRVRNNIANDGTWLGDSFNYTNDITPAQIVANTNNYNPTELIDAAVLRLNTDASRTITGLAGGSDGRCMIIHNIGANDIVFTKEDALSTAANRFLFAKTIPADDSILVRYDGVSSRWRLISASVGTGDAGATISDVAYDVTWDGNTTDGASKNALYDKFESIIQKFGSSFVVAASDAPAILKNRADYVCDGTADEVEINAALALGNVVMTQGNYYITSAAIQIPANRTLAGSGDSTILNTVAFSAINYVITNTGFEGIIIRDMKFTAPQTAGFAIYLNDVGTDTGPTGTIGCLIENIQVIGFRQTQIEVRSCSNVVINNIRCIAPFYDAINITNNGVADHSTNVTVSNSVIVNATAGVWVEYGKYVTIDGCVITGDVTNTNGQELIQVESASSHITITNNVIRNSEETNIWVGSADHILIANNVVDTCYNAGAGITCYADNTIITGNIIRNSAFQGIDVDSATNVVITNNVVDGAGQQVNNTYPGIAVTYCTRATIIGNTVSQGVAANKPSYGINVLGTVYSLVEGNSLYQSGVTGAMLATNIDETTIVRNNIDNDGKMFQQSTDYGNALTPTIISANQNNYSPSELTHYSVVRLSSDASRNITGLAKGQGTKTIVLYNVGANDIVFTNEDALSTAVNRFSFGYTLPAGGVITIQYDEVTTRWRLLTSPSAITLTGEVTGTGTSSITTALDKTAISNKTAVTINPADYILIGDTSDSDNLKKGLVSDIGTGVFIPLAGTGVGSPVTGNIQVSETGKNLWIPGANAPNDYNAVSFGEGGISIKYVDTVTFDDFYFSVSSSGVAISSNVAGVPSIGTSKGLFSDLYFAANYDDNTYVQKKYVVDNFIAIGSVPIPTLDQVTTAGNTSSNSIVIQSTNIISPNRSLGVYSFDNNDGSFLNSNGQIIVYQGINQITLDSNTQIYPRIRLRSDANFTLNLNADLHAANTNVSLPATSGTLALVSQITGTNSGTNTGDQTLTNTSNATSHTVTLSASGGSIQLVEGANITLTTSGTGSNGIVTIASTGGGASPLTTKGDIFTYDTANARLPVGTNGYVLSANSATATGLEWVAGGGGPLEWATSTGTRAGSNLTLGLGDYDDSGNGNKISLNDATGDVNIQGNVVNAEGTVGTSLGYVTFVQKIPGSISATVNIPNPIGISSQITFPVVNTVGQKYIPLAVDSNYPNSNGLITILNSYSSVFSGPGLLTLSNTHTGQFKFTKNQHGARTFHLPVGLTEGSRIGIFNYFPYGGGTITLDHDDVNYRGPETIGDEAFVLQNFGGNLWAGHSISSYNVSASNGLIAASGNVRLGGTLSQNTTIDNTTFTYTQNSTSTTDPTLTLSNNNANTTDVLALLKLSRTSSGTVSTLFGIGINFELETATNANFQRAGDVRVQWTNATLGAQTSRYQLDLVQSGATQTVHSIAGNGQHQFSKYGLGTFTGTTAYVLAVTSAGQIIEVSGVNKYTVTLPGDVIPITQLWTVTHNLNDLHVDITIKDLDTNEEIMAYTRIIDVNSVEVWFSHPVAQNKYRVTVTK